ncbi:MAG: hypothetical protein KF716_08935 [Anaerolineae bacterium]|nr:hypothetical protein [Anaerolineae bacterium]
MWYRKVHYRQGFNWLPVIVLLLFLLMGGWRLVFLIPPILVLVALFFIFSPVGRRLRQEYRSGNWDNWRDWSSQDFDGQKRKHNWYADEETDEAEAGTARTYDAKRKNDDDVYYV